MLQHLLFGMPASKVALKLSHCPPPPVSFAPPQEPSAKSLYLSGGSLASLMMTLCCHTSPKLTSPRPLDIGGCFDTALVSCLSSYSSANHAADMSLNTHRGRLPQARSGCLLPAADTSHHLLYACCSVPSALELHSFSFGLSRGLLDPLPLSFLLCSVFLLGSLGGLKLCPQARTLGLVLLSFVCESKALILQLLLLLEMLLVCLFFSLLIVPKGLHELLGNSFLHGSRLGDLLLSFVNTGIVPCPDGFCEFRLQQPDLLRPVWGCSFQQRLLLFQH
mmetsp:Transcript_43114/g.101259  ORF Transcript_43114/g.101259 Transcript_43114/m.101259 type:complete len:277 (+) Transcript_43114:424-1254(+)